MPRQNVVDLDARRAKKWIGPYVGLWYILDGRTPKRVTVRGWERWFATRPDNQRVAMTEVGDITVSTVFLGIDHAFGRGRPLLFETMVFGGDLDHECIRYSTYAEAEAGHLNAVNRVRAAERRPP